MTGQATRRVGLSRAVCKVLRKEPFARYASELVGAWRRRVECRRFGAHSNVHVAHMIVERLPVRQVHIRGLA